MYTINPQMPKTRMEAVRLVKYRGWSTRKVARYTGFSQSAIVKWCTKDPTGGWRRIPTQSSKPHHHAKQLAEDVVQKIVHIREKTKRTSEVVHQELLNQGVKVSLNSVRRTIDRAGLMKKRSLFKRYHPHVERPAPVNPGDLVQIDTIHRMIDEKKRLYIFVLIDVCSRWVYAKAYASMNSATMVTFVAEAQRAVRPAAADPPAGVADAADRAGVALGRPGVADGSRSLDMTWFLRSSALALFSSMRRRVSSSIPTPASATTTPSRPMSA